MSKEKKSQQINIDEELEQLPATIAYHEEQAEKAILDIETAKAEKEGALSDVLIKYEGKSSVIQKAMYKKEVSEHNKKIIELKNKLSKEKVALNLAKNRFQSIRKIASMRIEEMKHFNTDFNVERQVRK